VSDIITTNLGLTPEVARIHFDDLAQAFELHISWQLVTPFGAFPHREEVFTLGDLATVLNTIKAIWALTTDSEDRSAANVYCLLGDFSVLTTVPAGLSLRTEQTAEFPTGGVGDIEGPDTVPDYDGEADDWGSTPPV